MKRQDDADTETRRLSEGLDQPVPPWRKWGPYLSERSWATVREDYSPDGRAWASLPHDLARSKAYRWGEDGLAGISDRFQLLCFSPALWNGQDPILKERLFGLTPDEGNHGEDVKECYYYLDALPSHAYLKYLYKYPQAPYPYQELLDRNRARGPQDPEFELTDTGIFDQGRYFDVTVEYAKADPEDLAIRITVKNHGPDASVLHLVPQLWWRNTWAWGPSPGPAPWIRRAPEADRPGAVALVADDAPVPSLPGLTFDYRLGQRWFWGPDTAEVLFTDNETNGPRVYGPQAAVRGRWFKDAFHRWIVDGEAVCRPDGQGTKAGLHLQVSVPAGGEAVVRLRLSPEVLEDPLGTVDDLVEARRAEADRFYQTLHPPGASADAQLVQRQALAGMIWGKQTYLFDVKAWLEGDNPQAPPPPGRESIRNGRWKHLNSMRVLSLPDKWEYPWFAAWDLAFHTIPLALVDPEFAKEQLWLLLFEQFQHPNGQIPAYEWEFSDLNPPVHAWAVWRVFHMDRHRTGRPDRAFLEKCFHKLLINFSWWVNKVDSDGHNVFEGGFLGLDNITVIDRSQPLAPGTTLKQADATGWMAMFCLNLMRIALELAHENRVYEGLATKFFQHFVAIGAALKTMGGTGLWDEADGFFYDQLQKPDGSVSQFRLRSMVGLIPLFALERLEEAWIEPFPQFRTNLHWFLKNRPDLAKQCIRTVQVDGQTVHVLSVMNPGQIRRALGRLADPREFLSPYGPRSLSKAHAAQPFRYGGAEVSYEPAESLVRLKGGNSNWRGPIWFPTTFLLIESLRKLARAYGTAFPVDCQGLARQLAEGAISLFLADPQGRRPAHGTEARYADDPAWNHLVLFYEYFDGDTGRGLGASHQTGWTGLVAALIDEWS